MPVKSGPRPYQSDVRAAAADETRSRIIAAACIVLAGGRGQPAFSMDSVARQAQVTRLTVYNQFDSKRGLLEAVFDDLARQGGLFDLRSVLAVPDPHEALRQFVAVFCRFWTLHGAVISKLIALARLDEEIAASLKQRAERRRRGLTMLMDRFATDADRTKTDLIDVLFALTSFEMFDLLSVRQRGRESVEQLLQGLVADAVHGYGAARPRRAQAPRPRRGS